MKITLRSMGTNTFFYFKRVNTTNINKSFGGKTYLIIMNTKTIKNKKIIVLINFNRLKAKRGNSSRTE